MAGDGGMASAVAAAMAQAGQLVPEEAPAPLLPLLDAEVIEAGRGQPGGIGGAVAEARRVGRPRGAINKRTARMRDYLLSRYAHPAEVLAQTYSRPVDALAAELSCTRAEAMAVQIRAAAELLPYIESRMPVAVVGDIRGQVVLAVGSLTGAEGAQTIDGQAVQLGMSALAMMDDDFQGVSEA